LCGGKEIMQVARKQSFRILMGIYLWQTMERVYICFELTDGKVISASLSVKYPKLRRTSVELESILSANPSLSTSSRTEHFVSHWPNFYGI
jgi:hypothetical protein